MMKNIFIIFVLTLSSQVFAGTCDLYRIVLSDYGARAVIEEPLKGQTLSWEQCFEKSLSMASRMSFDVYDMKHDRMYLGVHWTFVGKIQGSKRKLSGEVNCYSSHYLANHPVKGYAMLDVVSDLLSAGIPDEDEKENGVDVDSLPRHWEHLFSRKK